MYHYRKITPFQTHAYEESRKKLKGSRFLALQVQACCAVLVWQSGSLYNIGIGLAIYLALIKVVCSIGNGCLYYGFITKSPAIMAKGLTTPGLLDAAVRPTLYVVEEVLNGIAITAICAGLWLHGGTFSIVAGSLFAVISLAVSISKEAVAESLRECLESLGQARLTGERQPSKKAPAAYKGEGVCELQTGLLNTEEPVVACNLDTRQMIGVDEGEEVKITSSKGNTIVRTVVKVPKAIMNKVHGRIFLTPKDYAELEINPDPDKVTVYVEPCNQQPKA